MHRKNSILSVNMPAKPLPADTVHTDPLLVKCWPSVADVGPALKQHWLRCPGCQARNTGQLVKMSCMINHEERKKQWVFCCNNHHLPTTCTTRLYHLPRLMWPPIKHIFCITFVQCWTNVGDVGPTLYKCYTKGLCLLGSGIQVWLSSRRNMPAQRCSNVGPAYFVTYAYKYTLTRWRVTQ